MNRYAICFLLLILGIQSFAQNQVATSNNTNEICFKTPEDHAKKKDLLPEALRDEKIMYGSQGDLLGGLRIYPDGDKFSFSGTFIYSPLSKFIEQKGTIQSICVDTTKGQTKLGKIELLTENKKKVETIQIKFKDDTMSAVDLTLAGYPFTFSNIKNSKQFDSLVNRAHIQTKVLTGRAPAGSNFQ